MMMPPRPVTAGAETAAGGNDDDATAGAETAAGGNDDDATAGAETAAGGDAMIQPPG